MVNSNKELLLTIIEDSLFKYLLGSLGLMPIKGLSEDQLTRLIIYKAQKMYMPLR
jgi:hypothetical protein